MPQPIDLTGQRFGRLVAIEVAGRGKYRLWKCRCDCGKSTVVDGASLRTGNTRSCGCLMLSVNTQHGHAGNGRMSSTYKTWVSIRERCRNTRSKHYQKYGGRGIKVCDRWQTFDNFLADMGERPSDKSSIDRINNNGNYEPGNCRWATPKEQARNTRATKLTELAAAQIRALPPSVSTNNIAQCLGVSFNAIHCCRTGKTWKPIATAHESCKD